MLIKKLLTLYSAESEVLQSSGQKSLFPVHGSIISIYRLLIDRKRKEIQCLLIFTTKAELQSMQSACYWSPIRI